nr:hypothetical protein [Tanacetum cinerariifolium]
MFDFLYFCPIFTTVSIPPTGEIPTVSVPTSSGVVPTASPIFTTAIVATPYSRRKGKEKMVESETPKKKKLQDKWEYEQFAADLDIEERIELINDLVKYQDNYAKVLKYQSQQRKPLSKKQQREFYMLTISPNVELLELMLSKSSRKNTKCVNAANEELTAAKHKLMLLVYCC